MQEKKFRRDKESTPTEEGERGKRWWWSEMRSGGKRGRRETTKKRKPREEKVERRQKVVERLGGVWDLGGVGTYPSGVFYWFVKINRNEKKKSQTKSKQQNRKMSMSLSYILWFINSWLDVKIVYKSCWHWVPKMM